MASLVACSALAVLLLVARASTAAATTYTVGDGSGWTTGVDYTTWAGSKNFKDGDSLGTCTRARTSRFFHVGMHVVTCSPWLRNV